MQRLGRTGQENQGRPSVSAFVCFRGGEGGFDFGLEETTGYGMTVGSAVDDPRLIPYRGRQVHVSRQPRWDNAPPGQPPSDSARP